LDFLGVNFTLGHIFVCFVDIERKFSSGNHINNPNTVCNFKAGARTLKHTHRNAFATQNDFEKKKLMYFSSGTDAPLLEWLE
jgi:hypothetical protein